jgi:hypothetical protein
MTSQCFQFRKFGSRCRGRPQPFAFTAWGHEYQGSITTCALANGTLLMHTTDPNSAHLTRQLECFGRSRRGGTREYACAILLVAWFCKTVTNCKSVFVRLFTRRIVC